MENEPKKEIANEKKKDEAAAADDEVVDKTVEEKNAADKVVSTRTSDSHVRFKLKVDVSKFDSAVSLPPIETNNEQEPKKSILITKTEVIDLKKDATVNYVGSPIVIYPKSTPSIDKENLENKDGEDDVSDDDDDDDEDEDYFSDHEGPYEKKVKEDAGRALEMIQGVNIFNKHDLSQLQTLQSDKENNLQQDPMKQMEHAHLLLQQQVKHNIWEDEENPTEEYLQEKEAKRIQKLARDRGPCISNTFIILYHVTVLFNFFFSLYESFRLTIEGSKLQALHLRGIFNCMEIVYKADWIDHAINIFHSLMSACVLFAESKLNAGLCIAYVISQALHTAYETFQFFMQIRFEAGHEITEMALYLFLAIFCDVITSVVIIQRYYDLTDRVRARAKYFSANVTDGKSMNDEIIYQNQSSYLQRKYILREAISSQVYKVIQKIGNYRDKGLVVDHVDMYRELNAAKAALLDVDNVENSKLLKELKKQTAKRLRDYDENPDLLSTGEIINGSMSKLFLVKFSDR